MEHHAVCEGIHDDRVARMLNVLLDLYFTLCGTYSPRALTFPHFTAQDLGDGDREDALDYQRVRAGLEANLRPRLRMPVEGIHLERPHAGSDEQAR